MPPNHEVTIMINRNLQMNTLRRIYASCSSINVLMHILMLTYSMYDLKMFDNLVITAKHAMAGSSGSAPNDGPSQLNSPGLEAHQQLHHSVSMRSLKNQDPPHTTTTMQTCICLLCLWTWELLNPVCQGESRLLSTTFIKMAIKPVLLLHVAYFQRPAYFAA